jgi:hypothetical protein
LLQSIKNYSNTSYIDTAVVHGCRFLFYDGGKQKPMLNLAEMMCEDHLPIQIGHSMSNDTLIDNYQFHIADMHNLVKKH